MLRFWCRICDLWFCVYCRPRSLDVQENLLIRIHSLWAITVGKEIWKLQIRNCVKKYAAHHFDFWSTHIGSGSTPCCEDMSIIEPSVNITVLLSIHIQSRIYKWNIFPFVLYWNFPLPSFHPGTLKVDVVHFWALIIIFISKSTLLFLQTCASCTNWLARSNMPP